WTECTCHRRPRQATPCSPHRVARVGHKINNVRFNRITLDLFICADRGEHEGDCRRRTRQVISPLVNFCGSVSLHCLLPTWPLIEFVRAPSNLPLATRPQHRISV